jgi:hypothetical protein
MRRVNSSQNVEIGVIDCQHERIVERRAIQPIWYDQIDSVGVSLRVGMLDPFVDHAAA